MATALSLSPLFRQSVGFDRFNDLFSTLQEQEPRNTFPPYDIIKTSDDSYQIVMAVAGYNEKDITISLEKDNLKISTKSENTKDPDIVYIHKGIAKRNFSKTFSLADHMKVEKADMENGILSILLYREVPEENKLRHIHINTNTN